jgi:hypothetical protein
MWKRDPIKRVKYCKVIPQESVITQHSLMIMEECCSGKKVNIIRKIGKELRIWKVLTNYGDLKRRWKEYFLRNY